MTAHNANDEKFKMSLRSLRDINPLFSAYSPSRQFHRTPPLCRSSEDAAWLSSFDLPHASCSSTIFEIACLVASGGHGSCRAACCFGPRQNGGPFLSFYLFVLWTRSSGAAVHYVIVHSSCMCFINIVTNITSRCEPSPSTRQARGTICA